MTFQNTEQFTKYWLSSVTSEAMQKQYPSDWYFDFRFTTQDLPFDWNQELFLNSFKNSFKFPIKTISLDFVEGRYICVGKVVYDSKPNFGSINESDEDFINKTLKETFRIINTSYPIKKQSDDFNF